MKPKEREKARRLRKQGVAIKPIAKRLGVSPSSVMRWCSDIHLTKKQQDALGTRNTTLGSLARSSLAAQRRESWRAAGASQCRKLDLRLAGCMLYWAEGAKHRNTLRFCNSDPDMVKLFARFLWESYKVPKEKFVVVIHCHLRNGRSLRQVETYWLRLLGLSRSSLGKSQVDKTSRASKKRRGHTLEFGVCHIKVHSTELVQKIRGAIARYLEAR